MRIYAVIIAVRVHTKTPPLQKVLKAIKIFHFAFGFAISQGGIAARTKTLMQGSKEKEQKNNNCEVS